MTEPSYVNEFVRMTRNATVEVEIHDEYGEPRRLVEMAKSKKQQARVRAKQQADDFLAYDEVWCAFDRDQHERFDDACQMARDNQLELAVSNPCIELWLLLHFRDSPGAQDRYRMKQLVKNFLPGYDKHLDFKHFAVQVGQAIERARHLAQEAERMGEPLRNPTTGFYRLIESIALVEPPASSTDSAFIPAGDFEPRTFELYFRRDRTSITKDHRKQLGEALALLQRFPQTIAVIEGSADTSETNNDQLLECRIGGIKSYLTSNDIAVERIHEIRPSVSKSTKETKSQGKGRIRLRIQLP